MATPGLRDLVSRAGRLLLRASTQTVPAAGVFGLEWHPAGGLMLYWVESALALGATALLLALFARRARAPERSADREAIVESGIATRDVLLVHGGAFGVFGLFFAGFLTILIGNGHVGSAGLAESLAGIPIVAALVGLELGVDLARFPRLTAADLAARVDAGNRRFVLFWIVGFFGVGATMLLGKPLLLFGVFAAVKLLFEVGSVLARTRAAASAKPPVQAGRH